MICDAILWPLNVPEAHLLSWSIVCAVLSPFVVLLNVLLIVAMYKTGDTKSITANLVIVMSISDIGIGVIVLPMVFTMVTFKGPRQSCSYQSATQFFALAVGYTSFLMLIAIAVDRYIRMSLLTKYESVVNKFRMKCVVVGIVFASLSFALVALFLMSFPFQMTAVGTNVTLISAIYIIYASMLYRLDKKFALQGHLAIPGCQNLPRKSVRQRRSRRKRDIAVARTVKILLGTIFVLYMPYNIMSSIWSYYRFYKKEDPGLLLNVGVFWTYIVLFLNSIANVFVYGHGNGKIRKYVVAFARGSVQGDNSNSKSLPETSSLWKQDDKGHIKQSKDKKQNADSSLLNN